MLSGCFRELKIDARVAVYFLRRFEVQLIERNVAVMLIANVEHRACHGVVANLLGRPTVLEDECDCLLVRQRLRRMEGFGRNGERLSLIGRRVVVAVRIVCCGG
jgi:hypothetical protein